MPEKPDYSQLELFSQDAGNAQYNPKTGREMSFFSRMRGYERKMLLIMALALTGIVSYSLGVKDGRQALISATGMMPAGGYTIQVAAFKDRQAALAGYRMLKKSGYFPEAFIKGEQIILCVGKFTSLESAQSFLVQLQKTYAGCRIRRL